MKRKFLVENDRKENWVKILWKITSMFCINSPNYVSLAKWHVTMQSGSTPSSVFLRLTTAKNLNRTLVTNQAGWRISVCTFILSKLFVIDFKLNDHWYLLLILTLVWLITPRILSYYNLHFLFKSLTPRKWYISTTIHVTKIPKVSSVGRQLPSHDNVKIRLLSNSCLHSVFDLLVYPEIMEKKRGWVFFSSKSWLISG